MCPNLPSRVLCLVYWYSGFNSVCFSFVILDLASLLVFADHLTSACSWVTVLDTVLDLSASVFNKTIILHLHQFYYLTDTYQIFDALHWPTSHTTLCQYSSFMFLYFMLHFMFLSRDLKTAYSLPLSPCVLCPAPGKHEVVTQQDVIKQHVSSKGPQFKTHCRHWTHSKWLSVLEVSLVRDHSWLPFSLRQRAASGFHIRKFNISSDLLVI